MQTLDNYINQVKTLPPAPRLLPELLTVLRHDNVDCSKVVELITFDPALTAKVLQTCNSTFFGASERVEDLQEAIARIGFNQIYRIVAAAIGERTLGAAQKGYGIARGELWRHSAVAAVAAQVIAHDLGEEENVPFTAALLHDIGKLVLAGAMEGARARMREETEENHQSLLEAEKKILGVEHAEVGGRVLARWNFPDNLVAAVWHHHDPRKAAPHEHLAAYVYLGNMIAHLLGHGYGHQAYALTGRIEALEMLKVTPDGFAEYMIQTQVRWEKVQSLLRVA